MTHYHFIGIGGIGMSALARILLKQKARVTGSDASMSVIIQDLIEEGAEISIGHEAKNVSAGASVVYNSMINKDNSELEQAIQLKCPLLHRSDVLGIIGKQYKTLAVTGTHGKTTTSSLLATVLRAGGLDPAYALGGLLLDGGKNGGFGKGEYFVVEADESDASFLRYPVFGAIVTNIDGDHLDHYGSLDALKVAFKQFMEGVANKELLFWCKDAMDIVPSEGVSYGFEMGVDLLGSNLRQEGWKSLFDVHYKGTVYKDVEVGLVGSHMALNALAVFGMAISLGIKEESIRLSLKSFSGVARRCEKKCDNNSILILDDYAHHPTEIKTTLNGIRKAIGNKNLIAVFQPHRYSRTQLCLNEYKDAFNAADELIITDIYGAFETPIPGLTAETILDTISDATSNSYIPKKDLKEALIKKIKAHDVIVTLNAGDLTKISEELGAHYNA